MLILYSPQYIFHSSIDLHQMKTILIPVDFSPASMDALRYGVAFAARYQAKVVLLHIYSPGEFEPFVPVSMQFALMDAKQELALTHFASIENEISDEILDQIDLEVKIEVGPVADQILWISKDIEADLIILGRRKEGKLIQKFLGNTATHILQVASTPVLIVPESTTFQGFQRIAYGTSLGREDIKAIDRVLDLARQHEAKVHCVHIQQEKAQMDSMKQEIIQEAYQHDLTIDQLLFDTIENSSISEGLNDYLSTNNMDLLVMLTHKRGILSQLFHGSHTKQVALTAKVPILAYQMEKSKLGIGKKKRAVA